jgi:hypothetical protein
VRKVVFYARPWSADLLMAVEDRWQRSGHAVDVSYISSHVEAVRRLAGRGRTAAFLPEETAKLDMPDPIGALEDLERRYGDQLLPLMRYLMADRTLAGRPRAWRMEQLARHAAFFDRFFTVEQPDVFIGEAPDTMPTWVAAELARQHGCTPAGITPSAMPPGRLLILRTHREIAGARERYERLRESGLTDEQLGAARALQDVVLGRGTKLDYLPPVRRPLGFLRRVLSGAVIRRQVAVALEEARERRAGNWFLQPNPVIHWLSTQAHAARAKVAARRYLNDPLSGRPFVFYPLQYQPEASTLVHASYFDNQIELVKNLARSMPAAWDLVVKEHFFMAGQRELGFYRSLRDIPNVRLAPFSIPTNVLIQQASVVAVITSTCGLEASLIGRPVVMFGDYPWDYAPTVHKVGALADLPALIRTAADSGLGSEHLDVLAFAASWDAALPPGRYYNNRQHDWLDDRNLGSIAEALWALADGRGGPPVDKSQLRGSAR